MRTQRGGGVTVCSRHQEEGRGGSGESSFSGGGKAKRWGRTSLYNAQGEGEPKGDESPFPRRVGDRDKSSFKEGVGDCDESPFSKRGRGP